MVCAVQGQARPGGEERGEGMAHRGQARALLLSHRFSKGTVPETRISVTATFSLCHSLTPNDLRGGISVSMDLSAINGKPPPWVFLYNTEKGGQGEGSVELETRKTSLFVHKTALCFEIVI